MLDKIKKVLSWITLGVVILFIMRLLVKKDVIKDDTKTVIYKVKTKNTTIVKYKNKLKPEIKKEINNATFFELVDMLKGDK